MGQDWVWPFVVSWFNAWAVKFLWTAPWAKGVFFRFSVKAITTDHEARPTLETSRAPRSVSLSYLDLPVFSPNSPICKRSHRRSSP